MPEINLLAAYPQTKRNFTERGSASEEDKRIAREFGHDYFDGPRIRGYGGYRYDGRWLPIAKTFVEHWNLKPGDRVLDVGCAKGFLVKDLMIACPGLEAYGLDVSSYALANAEQEVKDRLTLGNALKLPFNDGSFDAVISINTIHNLDRDGCKQALREMMRVSPKHQYVQVDAYRTPEDRELFLTWVLTAKTHDYPEKWEQLFKEAGYTGDYYWTIL